MGGARNQRTAGGRVLQPQGLSFTPALRPPSGDPFIRSQAIPASAGLPPGHDHHPRQPAPASGGGFLLRRQQLSTHSPAEPAAPPRPGHRAIQGDPARGARGCRSGSRQHIPAGIQRRDHIAVNLQPWLKPEGTGSPRRGAGMEFGHRPAVLGDHQHLTAGGHLILQAEAAALNWEALIEAAMGRFRELRRPPQARLTMVMTTAPMEARQPPGSLPSPSRLYSQRHSRCSARAKACRLGSLSPERISCCHSLGVSTRASQLSGRVSKGHCR